MEKFTSGDWRINQRPHGKISIVGDNGQQVCLMWNSKERDDNANLIKASKDMYRALRPFAEFACSPKGECDCHNCVARDALAKADGGSHE